VSCNRAVGGGADVDGEPGVGQGGGVYNTGSIWIDDLDLIFGNEAGLYDNCFGCSPVP
jgi:hypothetical protein